MVSYKPSVPCSKKKTHTGRTRLGAPTLTCDHTASRTCHYLLIMLRNFSHRGRLLTTRDSWWPKKQEYHHDPWINGYNNDRSWRTASRNRALLENTKKTGSHEITHTHAHTCRFEATPHTYVSFGTQTQHATKPGTYLSAHIFFVWNLLTYRLHMHVFPALTAEAAPHNSTTMG